MKTRLGFVSNSSSSSFVAVTISATKIIDQVLEALEVPEDLDDGLFGLKGWGCSNHGIYKHLDSGLEIEENCGEIYWVGLQIDDLLKKDLTLSACKQRLAALLNDIGIEVELNNISFHCDTCSDGG